jgi:hypothetical protein
LFLCNHNLNIFSLALSLPGSKQKCIGSVFYFILGMLTLLYYPGKVLVVLWKTKQKGDHKSCIM